MESNYPNYNKNDDIIQKVLKIKDSPLANIIKYFGEVLNFIEGKDKILIHCMAGVSRSSSFVIAYLMWNKKISYEDALNIVCNKRPNVFPNFGFREQLKMFDKLLKDNQYDINKIDFNNIKKQGKSIYFEW